MPETGHKTDDEILAEALGVFDEGIKNEQQAGNGQMQNAERNESGPGTLTESEQTQRLNKKLDDKFAKFDDLIRSEREAVARNAGGNGMGNGSGTGDFENGEGEMQEDPMQTAMIDDNTPLPPVRSQKPAGGQSDR